MPKNPGKSVYAELSAAVKCVPSKGEEKTDYLVRLVAEINKLEDGDFDKLSEPARNWFNTAGQFLNEKKPDAMPDPDGLPEFFVPNAETPPSPNKKAKKKKSAAQKPAKATSPKVDQKKSTAKASAGKRGRSGTFSLSDEIALLVKENPKRPGSRAHKIYPLYAKCKTVGDYLKAGGRWSDLRWDSEKKFISISTK